MSENFNFELMNNGMYKLHEKIVYHSPRYQKTCTVPSGYVSDGASGPATDIVSEGWWVHDWLCEKKRWDDGSHVSPWQSSAVLHDILLREGRWFRARSWFLATFIFETWKNWRVDGKPTLPTIKLA